MAESSITGDEGTDTLDAASAAEEGAQPEAGTADEADAAPVGREDVGPQEAEIGDLEEPVEPLDSDHDADAEATDPPGQARAGDEDTGAHGSGFAGVALRVLVLVLVIFGLSLWLVPMLAPHLPARIAAHVMPGQERLDARLAAIDAMVADSVGKYDGRIVELEAEVAALNEKLGAAEAALAEARERVSAAERAASASAEAASSTAVAEAVVADAQAAAARATEATETATAAATEAGKVAAAATRDVASLTRQMTSFEARLSSLSEELSALATALANGTAGGTAAAPELTAAFAALKSRVDGLGERLRNDYVTRELADRFATQDDLRSARTALEAEAAARFEQLPAPSELVTTTALEAVRASIDGKVAELADRITQAASDASAAAASAQAAEAASTEAMGRVDTAIRDASLRAAIAALTSRLENGAPFGSALGEIESLTGKAPPEALARLAPSGVATHEALLRSFGRNAQDALAADIRSSADDGILGQASARLRSVVAGRPKSELEGDDAGAILSRVEARLKDGDLGGALAESESLSEAARAAMQSWLERLRARVTAEATAADYIAGLRRSQG